MTAKTEFITSVCLPKGSVWKATAQVVGGTRLEGLQGTPERLAKVTLSIEAFAALKRLRRPGETVRETIERLIYTDESR